MKLQEIPAVCPQFLVDAEKEYIGKIKSGETLKDIETLRQRKDGTIIEVSLTLSPIKDTAGEVIGISGITRDMSRGNRVGKELKKESGTLKVVLYKLNHEGHPPSLTGCSGWD